MGRTAHSSPSNACAPVNTLRRWPAFTCDGPMQTLRFDLERDHVELNQLLKLVGLCDSGGAGKHLVASGAVRVDGSVELRKTCKIHAGQVVSLDGVRIEVVAAG